MIICLPLFVNIMPRHRQSFVDPLAVLKIWTIVQSLAVNKGAAFLHADLTFDGIAELSSIAHPACSASLFPKEMLSFFPASMVPAVQRHSATCP